MKITKLEKNNMSTTNKKYFDLFHFMFNKHVIHADVTTP